MCLTLDLEKTKRYKTRVKPIRVYKLMIRLPPKGGFRSPYRPYVWGPRPGRLEFSSNRPDAQLTPAELQEGEVGPGFHFFTRKRDVYHNSYDSDIIAVFEVDPKDIVAVGTFHEYNSLVATKATFIEFER